MRGCRAAVAALFVFIVAFVAFASVRTTSFAAVTGLAWDSVTRVNMNADASALAPGSFDADYATAANAKPMNMGPAAMFIGKDRVAAAQYAEQMVKDGIAEHHYVAGSKERIDEVTPQTATIVDCAARTITTLDLKARTYRVTPIESPSGGGGAGGGDSSSGDRSDTRISITVENTALGQREVSGQSANGFRSKMTMTETSSSGESHTANGDLVGYYSSYADPTQMCRGYRPPTTGAHMGNADMMGGFARVMRVLGSAGDPRFTIKQSGPPLPLGKLAMYSALVFSGQGHMGAFITERGNVRPIDPNDPVFSVPSDFTRQQ
jgi:hypothetical protein